MGQPGFVYVLTNPAMPGLVKIGMTTKSPVTRAEELSTTGVPAPFEIQFAVYVNDAADIEKQCHQRFANRRYRNDREFFRVEPSEVAVFALRKTEVLEAFSFVSSEEDSAYADIGLEMNRVSPRELHPIEVASALQLLTPEELRNLSLRYQGHCDQLQAQHAAREEAIP